MSGAITKHSISSQGSTTLLRAAQDTALAMNVPVSIAVVDEAGHLKGFARMDGSPAICVEIARNKAGTAASFGLGTHLWYDRLAGQPALVHGLSHAAGFTLLGGGMPVVLDGQVIGGIGVSGGSAEEDLAIAEAALAALTAAATSPA